jgi:polyisoprenoid-binding protein YceI
MRRAYLHLTRVIFGRGRRRLTPVTPKLSPMTTAEQPISTTWRVDAVHSTVAFAVKHMIVSTFRGRFETYDATLVDVGQSLAIDGWVDVSSIVVKDPDLAAHLQSPEFFDAANHPQLRFTSTDIAVADDGATVVIGELTIKGRTRPLRASGSSTPALEDPFGGIRRGLELEAVIDRRDYGLDWNLPLPKGGLALDNDVRLLVNLEFTRV